MPTKRLASAKSKLTGFASEVKALESCIAADRAKLQKVYPKILSDVDKAIVRKTQELKKAKQTTKTSAKASKGSKTGSFSKAKSAALVTLEKALDALKSEKSMLQSCHKKFVAIQKSHEKIEKIWLKSASKSSKPKKLAKKKVARKIPGSESRSALRQGL